MTTLNEAPQLTVGQKVKFGHYEASDFPHFLEGEVVEPFHLLNENWQIAICRIKPSPIALSFAKKGEDGCLWLDDATVIDDDGTVHCLPNEVTP